MNQGKASHNIQIFAPEVPKFNTAKWTKGLTRDAWNNEWATHLRVGIKLHSYRGCVFQSSPFFEGAASLNCYLIKRLTKEEKERKWGEDVPCPLKGWLIPPDREILILNLKVLIFTSLKSTAFDDTNTRVKSIAFLCKVTWTRTSSIIIHWTFCATLSVEILKQL